MVRLLAIVNPSAMARKKNRQKPDLPEVSPYSSSLPHEQVTRLMNQNNLRTMKPNSDNKGAKNPKTISPVPPHPSDGPSSTELQEVINAYHYAIHHPTPSPHDIQTQKTPSMVEALRSMDEEVYNVGQDDRDYA